MFEKAAATANGQGQRWAPRQSVKDHLDQRPRDGDAAVCIVCWLFFKPVRCCRHRKRGGGGVSHRMCMASCNAETLPSSSTARRFCVQFGRARLHLKQFTTKLGRVFEVTSPEMHGRMEQEEPREQRRKSGMWSGGRGSKRERGSDNLEDLAQLDLTCTGVRASGVGGASGEAAAQRPSAGRLFAQCSSTGCRGPTADAGEGIARRSKILPGASCRTGGSGRPQGSDRVGAPKRQTRRSARHGCGSSRCRHGPGRRASGQEGDDALDDASTTPLHCV